MQCGTADAEIGDGVGAVALLSIKYVLELIRIVMRDGARMANSSDAVADAADADGTCFVWPLEACCNLAIYHLPNAGIQHLNHA